MVAKFFSPLIILNFSFIFLIWTIFQIQAQNMDTPYLLPQLIPWQEFYEIKQFRTEFVKHFFKYFEILIKTLQIFSKNNHSSKAHKSDY